MRWMIIGIVGIFPAVAQAQVLYIAPPAIPAPAYYAAPSAYYVAPSNYFAPNQNSNPKTQIERYYFLSDSMKQSTPTARYQSPSKPARTIIREYYYFSPNDDLESEELKPLQKADPPMKVPPPEELIGDKAKVDSATKATDEAPKNSSQNQPPAELPKELEEKKSSPAEAEDASKASETSEPSSATETP